MPNFTDRSHQSELMDDLSLGNDALRQNLEELETINTLLGGYQVVLDALQSLYDKKTLNRAQPTQITDIGSGGGDTLRAIHRWAAKRQLPVQLTGVDANAFMIDFATDKARPFPGIHFAQADIFAPEFAQYSSDVFVCSLFCHHFTEKELIRLFTTLAGQCRKAIIVNDLHRHWFAYYSIKWLTRLFNGSYLVQHDAPLSVWRAFVRQDLDRLMAQCGFSNYELRWRWAFRWQLIIWKTD